MRECQRCGISGAHIEIEADSGLCASCAAEPDFCDFCNSHRPAEGMTQMEDERWICAVCFDIHFGEAAYKSRNEIKRLREALGEVIGAPADWFFRVVVVY